MLPSIQEAGGVERPHSESSGSHSSNWQNDDSGDRSSSDAELESESEGAEQKAEESSDSSESQDTSIGSSTPLGPSPGAKLRIPGASFRGAVSGLVDMVQGSLHVLQPPGPRATSKEVAAEGSKEEADELARVPSLRSLLKFPEDESHGGDDIFAKRTQRFKDAHGRAKLNANMVSFESLALGFGRKSKKESDLQKSWGEIAGKLAFVLTKVDQVVPMSKSRLLNEALGAQDRRLSDESRQLLEMVVESKKFLGRAFHTLLESDPVRVLKDSLEARFHSGPGGGLFAQQEELCAYEKEINAREHQLDNPEFVDMMLQRWFAQRGFCVDNMAERRQLAEDFWKVQCSNKKKKMKRLQTMSTRKSMRSSMSVEAFQSVLSMQSEQEQDMSAERVILLEIRRAMTKLKRKCRVLEGQWVEQPKMMLPRLEKQCRTLRIKVEDKFSETETTRQKLCEADARWQRSRDGYEPTLVDLELQAWDTRVELAKSVIRWVRRDRKEQQVEWNAQMAKYHADKTRMRGNFDYTVRRWREDGCLTSPGFNPWKASLVFTPESVKQVDVDDRNLTGKVQVEQGLTIAGLTRHYLINQEKLLDNAKRPLGNRWELLRRQYVNYCRILEGQIEFWLRGDFLGPVLRTVREVTGHLNTFIQEVLLQLEQLREGALADLHAQGQGENSQGVRRSVKPKESSRADVRMEDALTAVLVHAEKEHSFLVGLTAFNGELSELVRCQSELSGLAARRPFTFQDLCGGERSIRGDLPPISFQQLEEGIESPAKAARQLARLTQINWTTYLLKWEVLIGKYKAAREAYVDYLEKTQESARLRLMKQLKENPQLKQELMHKTRSKMKEVEDEFYKTHIQPEVLRSKSLSAENADLGLQLQEMKSKTRHLEQDVSLNFMKSLELESHEVLLKRYQTEFEEEEQRAEHLDKQLTDAKERQRAAMENTEPRISWILQVNQLLRQLDEAKAEEQMRRMLFLDEVVHGDEIRQEEAKKSLTAKGWEATSSSKQLLRILQSLSTTWANDQNETSAPISQAEDRQDRQDSKKGTTEAVGAANEVASEVVKPSAAEAAAEVLQPPTPSKSAVLSVQEVDSGNKNEVSEKENTKQIARRLSWRLPSSSSLDESLAGSDEGKPQAQLTRITTVTIEDLPSEPLSEERPLPPAEEAPKAPSEVHQVIKVADEHKVDINDIVMTPGRSEADDIGVQVESVIDLTEEVEIQEPEVVPTSPSSKDALMAQPDLPPSREDLELEALEGSVTNPTEASGKEPASESEATVTQALTAPNLERRVVLAEPEITEESEDSRLKSPQSERRVAFDDNEEILEDTVTRLPKAPQVEVPNEPLEESAEMQLPYPDDDDDEEEADATQEISSSTSMQRPASKKGNQHTEPQLKKQNSITVWMQEVSRALLAHTEEAPREEKKSDAARASLLVLLNRRKRRRGLPTSLWPQLSVGNSKPTTRKDFLASQPLRTKKARFLRSDTPDLKPSSVQTIVECASPASASCSPIGRSPIGRSPTGRLRKRLLKANSAGGPALPDFSPGPVNPKASPRVSLGKLCAGTTQFRSQLPTRSFHGSGSGFKLAVGPGLEAFLWGHTRPRGEWRGLLQPKKGKEAGALALEDLVIRPPKEKRAKAPQRRRRSARQLYQVETVAKQDNDFTILPAARSSVTERSEDLFQKQRRK